MYTQYAQISADNTVIEYPVNPRSWDISKGDFNVDIYWQGGELNGKIYVLCHNMEPATQYDEALIEKTPAINPDNGLWYRQYDVVKVSPEVLEERRAFAAQGAQNTKAMLLRDYAEKESMIASLSIEMQQKWAEYYASIVNMETHPGYSFSMGILPSPDTSHKIKLQVTRI